MNLRSIIIESLDDLASSRTSLARRGRALDTLEHVLANVCVGQPQKDLDVFEKIQDSFECNIASRLMYTIPALIPTLQQTPDSATVENLTDLETLNTSRIIIQTLSILQGISLLHPPSKSYLGKKWCIQIFIDLLSNSRHQSTPLSSTTNIASSTSPTSSSMSSLASSTIDTLLCILVDSPTALRAFEEADGVDVVVKTLKRTGVARDIRIKCLEFLYFYLLDETGDVTPVQGSESKTLPLMPSTPNKPRIDTPLPSNLDPSVPASCAPSPQSCPRTPRKRPKNLGMLRKDVDFVPMTPKREQATRLGVGTPRPRRTPGEAVVSPTKPGRTSPVDPPGILVSPKKRRVVAEGSIEDLRPAGNQNVRRRSTQEKKEILGSLLGNVDALVEGVSKSGIWGLG